MLKSHWQNGSKVLSLLTFLILTFPPRTEEKAKEDENIKHQIRKIVEQQNIEHTNIDILRQDFLKLHPSKTQKPRIDAAYENQKRKIKDKIASLERKKQTLEGKLRYIYYLARVNKSTFVSVFWCKIVHRATVG